MLRNAVTWNVGRSLSSSICFVLILGFLTPKIPVFALNTTKDSNVAGAGAVSLQRLPRNVEPLSYALEFEPDAAKASFKGKASIKINVSSPCKTILLNAHDLKVLKADITGGVNSKPLSALCSYEPKQERVKLSFPSTVPVGSYNLDLSFTGILNDKLVGFYRSKFVDHAGKSHYLAVTQMEPADARRMFPCFDEPDFKATFQITAIIDPNQNAISNAQVEKEQIDVKSKKKIVRFAATPKMSTYLLALLIGEFKATEAVVSEGIKIRVWSVDRDPKLGNYARDMAAKILPYLNSYFGISYPWTKLDLIAIPDFEAGAMENPGAITFRETLLLADDNSSLGAKQSLVSVTAHEMAHLWFGDLVTMKWWDDLWLNEAFATWMAVKAVDHVLPEWNFLTEFGSERQQAMRIDSLHSSRPIHAAVKDPSEALQMFDEITYAKGASILRMLEIFLGENIFQEGIHNYLQEHSFNNASTLDLWQALSAVSKQPVAQIMDGWANQAGYPLLTLKPGTTPGSLKVSQERFFINGGQSKALWKVPLKLRLAANGDGAQSSQVVDKLLEDKNSILELKDSTTLLSANAGGYGFYRVLYQAKNLEAIVPHIETALEAPERLNLLSDQFALAASGKIWVQDYLKILSAFKKDNDMVVWEVLLRQLGYFNLFVEPSQRAQYESFIRYMLSDIYKSVGWEAKKDDPAMMRIIRGQVISMLGTLGQDKAVIEEARKRFAKYIQKPTSVNPDLLDAITSSVAYNGNAKDFETLKLLWKKAQSPEVEKRNLFALAQFRNPVLINRCLAMTLGTEVRTQDQPRLLGSLLHNYSARFVALDFMRNNWPRINKIYSTQMLAGLSSATDSFTTEDKYREIKSFFATHKVVAGESDIARMLERLQSNIGFAKRSAAFLNVWLKNWKP